PGIWVDANSSALATIRGNSMENNSLAYVYSPGLGVDLANDGVATHNDLLDADGFQNFPIILSATPGAGSTAIHGFLNSKPSTIFTLDFYSNPACVRFPRNFLEGRTYLGSGQVTTDGSGNGTFDVVVPVAIAAGERVTATATNPDGSTSEFSQRLPFSMGGLTSGPPGARLPITINGTNFPAAPTPPPGDRRRRHQRPFDLGEDTGALGGDGERPRSAQYRRLDRDAGEGLGRGLSRRVLASLLHLRHDAGFQRDHRGYRKRPLWSRPA